MPIPNEEYNCLILLDIRLDIEEHAATGKDICTILHSSEEIILQPQGKSRGVASQTFPCQPSSVDPGAQNNLAGEQSLSKLHVRN